MTKVTYYMYSCDTCCKIKERMKWTAEIVPCVKIKTKGDMMRIFDLLMRIRTKDEQCSSSPNEIEHNNVQ